MQVSALRIVPAGQTHCPLVRISGALHVVTQLAPFHAVLIGQAQTELTLSNAIPPEQVMH